MAIGQDIIEQDILDLLKRTQEEMDSYAMPLSMSVQNFTSNNYLEDERLSKQRSLLEKELEDLALKLQNNGSNVRTCFDIVVEDVEIFFENKSMQAFKYIGFKCRFNFWE